MDLRPLLNDNPCTIVLVVMDGLGGYADAEFDTELEEANTPNLDRMAAEGVVGLVEPAGPGITVGSGPGHLALFGYDPYEFDLGRGVLSAMGLDFDLQPGDVAARANLATLDERGRIVDRRAGRISDEAAQPIVDKLNAQVELDGVEVFFRLESEHRVLVVWRGDGLDPRIQDMDPQRTGVAQPDPVATHPDAERTADAIKRTMAVVRDVLRDEAAHTMLLRGFDTLHALPQMQERFGVEPATVAIYPMYRGVAKLVGMRPLDVVHSPAEQIELMRRHRDAHDYFFMHHKEPDRAGHDGERDAKIRGIEELDAAMPALRHLDPDVIVVTGDHSSPTQMFAHSWHPVPTLMWGRRVGRDRVTSFGERAAVGGLLGLRRTQDLMPLMLASAGRLEKYGA